MPNVWVILRGGRREKVDSRVAEFLIDRGAASHIEDAPSVKTAPTYQTRAMQAEPAAQKKRGRPRRKATEAEED